MMSRSQQLIATLLGTLLCVSTAWSQTPGSKQRRDKLLTPTYHEQANLLTRALGSHSPALRPEVEDRRYLTGADSPARRVDVSYAAADLDGRGDAADDTDGEVADGDLAAGRKPDGGRRGPRRSGGIRSDTVIGEVNVIANGDVDRWVGRIAEVIVRDDDLRGTIDGVGLVAGHAGFPDYGCHQNIDAADVAAVE